MESNECELLNCKSRKAVEDFVKDLKASYISRMELPHNHRLTKKEIEDIPFYINTDKLTHICLGYAFIDPLHTSNKYLASQLMVQLIYQLDLNGRDVYNKLILKTQTNNPNVYYFLLTDVRGQDCLSLAQDGKTIGEPILTARQFKKALLKIINTQGGDHYLNSGLYDLYTSVLAPIINWNLPFGPMDSFAAVPIPTR